MPLQTLMHFTANMKAIMDREQCLRDIFSAHEPFLIALSGGTDSLTLAACAKASGVRFAAVMLDTGLCPEGEPDRAAEYTDREGIPFRFLRRDMLAVPEVRENAPLRCLACKREMMKTITAYAVDHAFSAVMDGTNADDRPEERPGMQALREYGIISPFAACGIGREGIRRLAEMYNVPLIPPSSCLATRFPFGTRLDNTAIDRVRRAEALLRRYVDGRLRVRDEGGHAIIEAEVSEHSKIREHADALCDTGFTDVTIIPAKR